MPNSLRAHRPPTVDVLIAAGFAVAGQVVTWGELGVPESFSGPRGANAVLNLLLMAALAWRRQAPMAALSWAVAVYFLSHAVVPHDVPLLVGFVPLIVLTASAGYYCRRRMALLAAVVGVVGLTAVTLSTPVLRTLDAFAFNTAFLLSPWLGARGLRKREDRAAAAGAALARERAGQDAALREVVAGERARIARELHDVVAHSVSVMLIQVGAARMQLSAGVAGSEVQLLAAEDVGRQALDDLRRLLGVLRVDSATGQGPSGDPQPPQPGLSQLAALVAQTRAAGVRVEVRVEGEPVALPTGLDLTAYRIVQEALTNTLKHSGAANATVRLVYRSSSLLLQVIDDGPHSPTKQGNGNGNGHGHGLIGINERVSLFGGTAATGRVLGGGWQVQAELPLRPPSAQAAASPSRP